MGDLLVRPARLEDVSAILQLVAADAIREARETVPADSHLRGKGIGRTLMAWAIAEARRRGAVRVQLTSNNQRVDAHRFYERLATRRSRKIRHFVGSHLGMKLYLGGQA